MDTQLGISKKVTKGAITLDNLAPAKFKKDLLSAQIRQIVTIVTTYPSVRVDSDKQNSLFSAQEFDIKGQDFINEENRVAFIFVPMINKETGKPTTADEIAAKLAAVSAKGGCIYKVLGSKPSLDSNQLAGIEAGLTTLNVIANAQAVRFPVGNEKEGQLITDANGNPQYRKTYFWASPKEDVDNRGEEEAYFTPEIKAELMGASVIEGQTV